MAELIRNESGLHFYICDRKKCVGWQLYDAKDIGDTIRNK